MGRNLTTPIRHSSGRRVSKQVAWRPVGGELELASRRTAPGSTEWRVAGSSTGGRAAGWIGAFRGGWSATSRMCAALGVFAVAACSFDRVRPSPVEPDTQASLSVEVLAPLPGTAVFGGTDLAVEVSGRDLAGNSLTGIGYVVRRSGSGGNATLDSSSFDFVSTTQATHVFNFAVPVNLPTNTQLDIFGIAYGPGTQARVSVPRSVVVVPRAEAPRSVDPRANRR